MLVFSLLCNRCHHVYVFIIETISPLAYLETHLEVDENEKRTHLVFVEGSYRFTWVL